MHPDFSQLSPLSFRETMDLIHLSPAAKQPVKSKPRGYLLLGTGIFICAVLLAVIVYYSSSLSFKPPTLLLKFLGMIIFIAPVYLFIMPGLKLLKDAGAPAVQEGNYVLYLRSFRSDHAVNHWQYGLLSSPENAIKNAFRAYGPLVGLGARGEEASFGGYRLFIDSQNWRQIIFNLLRHSGLIVMYYSDRPEVQWELQLCRQYADPTRFVIYIDQDAPGSIAQINASGIANGSIVSNGDRQCFIAFNEHWEPFDPLLHRLQNKPFTAGLMHYVLGRKYGFRESIHTHDESFGWISRFFSWQVLPIMFVLVSAWFSLVEMRYWWEWTWLPVLLTGLAYMYVFYNWIFVSLKFHERSSFLPDFETGKQTLKKEVRFIKAGFILQALPVVYLVVIIADIFLGATGTGLSAIMMQVSSLLQFLGPIWLFLVMGYLLLFIIGLQWRIREKKRKLAEGV